MLKEETSKKRTIPSFERDEQELNPNKKIKQSQSNSLLKEQKKEKTNQKLKHSNLTPSKKPKATSNQIFTQNRQAIPVDLHFTHSLNHQVLRDQTLGLYSLTLNKSDIASDNNKFYIIQVLENVVDSQCYVFMRWGRVGIVGQMSESGPMSKEEAIKLYRSKVQDKLKSGGYKIIETLNDNLMEKQIESYILDCQPEPPSHLSQKLQDLIRLIFDFRMMSSHMKQIGYDNKRSPLGLLAKGSIDRGYAALDALMSLIKEEGISESQRKKKISEASSQFYSAIPHDFGYMNMQTFVLDTEDKIKQKLEMLASLTEIQICSRLLNDKTELERNKINELDLKYSKLKSVITPLVFSSKECQSILKYVQNTHGKSHSKYSLQVLEIYSIYREEEQSRYVGDDIGNKMLLWHGSRLTNFVGILSEGLKIAPYEAPMTGYMFGKGIYFADVVSKAANYCLPSKINNIGLMLLCEVALGETKQLLAADYTAHNLPPGKHSTHGVGQNVPNGGEYLEGIWMPNGSIEPSTTTKNSALLYNEYVVYRREQIKCRYLVKVKFMFK